MRNLSDSIPASVGAKYSRLPAFMETETRHRDPDAWPLDQRKYLVTFIDKDDGKEGQIPTLRFLTANRIASALIAEGHTLLHIWNNRTHCVVLRPASAD
ncbi:hypothetical protein K2O51_30875 (plasmid) [Cupriavidus pinatubonensis]|uniref:hypothetical protein n=1 Tax=Cupriavidus pinatubonensis TaxID=248026 RepID=UPI001C73938B|nr:hypothetical protein [Cupriavidus pinatubonensis]QYY33653.1 hypothetical protein K2O51_30875 [Cupriavidus pinatubonensis]